MLKASDCIFLDHVDPTQDLYIKRQMFGVGLSSSKYYSFPIITQKGLVHARWQFCQICLSEVLVRLVFVKFFKTKTVVLKWCCCNSAKICKMRNLKELIFKLNLKFSCCAVLKEKHYFMHSIFSSYICVKQRFNYI